MTNKVNITTDAGADAAMINEAVAARLKRYRAEKKISLDELSRRAGVSKGLLVDIEACRANPSIALLCRLASALGVSVADFVNVAAAPPVKVMAARDIPTLWQGERAVMRGCLPVPADRIWWSSGNGVSIPVRFLPRRGTAMARQSCFL